MQTLSQKRADLSVGAGLLQGIKRTVEGLIPDSQVILYGSHSRGEGTSESDLDLLVLLPDSVSPAIEEKLDRALYELELKHGIVLSTLVYTQATWEQPGYRAIPLRRSIEREGVLL